MTGPIRNVFAPGCALVLYNEELATEVHDYLNASVGEMEMYLTCCRHEPPVDENLNIINICPGCDKRFGNSYPGTTTVSLWEIIAGKDDFPFPDYGGRRMALLDACPARENGKIHDSVRKLLEKMNIVAVEPRATRGNSVCCGDSFYGTIPVSDVKKQMTKRAAQMPSDDVVVYCVSCTKSMIIGGKKPHYLVDLLFNRETVGKTLDPDQWHLELEEYIDSH